MKYLILGTRYHEKYPQTIGGTTILMNNLYEYFKEHKEFGFVFFNTFANKYYKILNYPLLLLFFILKSVRSKVIMINCARNGAFYIFPILYLFTKIFRKKLIFRMFGGNLMMLLSDKREIHKKIFIKAFSGSDIVFLETKYLIKEFNNLNPNIHWFPNVRLMGDEKRTPTQYRKKFVFISQVKPTKGVDIIIETFSKLDDSLSVHLYGPIMDTKYSKEYFENFTNIFYEGSINSNEVIPTLKNCDILLLPTFHAGEGYPGIIVEAYSVGLPVITTKWNSIPEIVNDGRTGFLIEPKSSEALLEAIGKISPKNFEMMTRESLSYSKNFCSNSLNREIMLKIQSLHS